MAKVILAVLSLGMGWARCLALAALTAFSLLACSGENEPREQEQPETAEAKAALSSGEWPSQTLLATNSIQLEDRAKVTGNHPQPK